VFLGEGNTSKNEQIHEVSNSKNKCRNGPEDMRNNDLKGHQENRHFLFVTD